MPDGVAIIEIWHYECIVQTHFTFLIKVFWDPGNSMQLSCGLSAYIFNLTWEIQVNVDEDAQDFTFVSIGISMLETLKLVGNGVDPCGIIIPWNLDGLASISFIVYQFTAMAAHCSRRNFNLSMFLSE